MMKNIRRKRKLVYNICIVTLHYDSEIYFQYIYCKVNVLKLICFTLQNS